MLRVAIHAQFFLYISMSLNMRYAAGYVHRAMRKGYNLNPEVLLATDELIDNRDGEGDEGSDQLKMNEQSWQ